MNKDDFYYLGKVLKTYGNKGQLLVQMEVDNPENYLDLESVYIDTHGERIPFFLTSLELKHHRRAIFQFQDINSVEDAEVFSGLEMYLPVTQLPILEGNGFYFHEVIGYTVTDSHHGNIGSVEDILELPQQSLLQIRHGDKEILIPIVDEIIKSVNHQQKKIEIEAPAGLIDIYL
ncbi:MAG: ribosome maturation factor RimM [Bacteroidales bacterium]|nr:ribosome maturation factor RimM [Bacteroidales bacterium]